MTEQVDFKKRQSIKNAVALGLGLVGGSVGGMLTSGSVAGIGQGEGDSRYVRKQPPDTETIIVTSDNKGIEIKKSGQSIAPMFFALDGLEFGDPNQIQTGRPLRIAWGATSTSYVNGHFIPNPVTWSHVANLGGFGSPWARITSDDIRTDVLRNVGGIQLTNMAFGTIRMTVHIEANQDATYDLGTGTTRRFRDLAITRNLGDFTSSANDLTTTDVPANKYRLHKNTSTGSLKLYANDGGIIKSVTLA